MKASLQDKLARADERLEELDALLSQPEIAGDMDRYRKLTREHADLTPVVVDGVGGVYAGGTFFIQAEDAVLAVSSRCSGVSIA